MSYFKLDKESGRIGAYKARLDKSKARLENYISVTEKHIVALNSLIEAHNEIVVEFNGHMEDIARDFREKFDGYSSRWQESDKGQATEEWLSELETFALDELEQLDGDEFLDMEFPDVEAELGNIPEEPDC